MDAGVTPIMTSTGRRYRLLIVEDNAADSLKYSQLLAQRGHGLCDIQQAGDGATALAALRSQKPDCVLLDFTLPDMSGLDFLTAATVDGALPCAFVFITGHGNELIAVEAM